MQPILSYRALQGVAHHTMPTDSLTSVYQNANDMKKCLGNLECEMIEAPLFWQYAPFFLSIHFLAHFVHSLYIARHNYSSLRLTITNYEPPTELSMMVLHAQ